MTGLQLPGLQMEACQERSMHTEGLQLTGTCQHTWQGLGEQQAAWQPWSSQCGTC